MERGYKIRLARLGDIPFLPDLEMAASRVFPDDILPRWMWGQTLDSEELANAYRNQSVFVAEHYGELVGFALYLPVKDVALLYEVNVLPEDTRHGVGSALVEAVAGAAAERGFSKMWVTAFDNVPWSIPFYRRAGFRLADSSEMPEPIRQLMKNEKRRGLHRRIALSKDLRSQTAEPRLEAGAALRV